MMPLSADPIDDLTADTLTELLRRTFGEIIVQSVQSMPVGTGQMASSYRLILTYADPPPAQAPTSLIAKVSSRDEASQQMAAVLAEITFLPFSSSTEPSHRRVADRAVPAELNLD